MLDLVRKIGVLKIGNMELWVLGMNANYILVLSWKKIWIELRGREVKDPMMLRDEGKKHWLLEEDKRAAKILDEAKF